MKKITEVIKEFFKKDWGWKLASLGLAIIIWFVVMNTLNPTEEKTFTVNLTFTNEAALNEGTANIIINRNELENTKVAVKVKGTRPALDELSKAKNKAEIHADVDLSQLAGIAIEKGPQELYLSVLPKLPENTFIYSYEIVGCNPKSITANVDSLKSETMKLDIQVSGSLKAGYTASEAVCDTDTVTVSGPASMMDQVAEVRAGVDIANKTDNVSVSVAPAVYDKDGNIMELFTVEPSVIDVSVDISKQWSIPVKEPEVTGELVPTLALESIDYEPKSIEVIGGISDINKVQFIQIPPIDLAQIENTKTLSFDVRPSFKDTDIQLLNGKDSQVKVTVKVISKESMDVTLKEADFKVTGLGEGYKAVIEDSVVTLYGAKLQGNVTGASLAPTLDVTGKAPGRYHLTFTLTLPEGVEVLNDGICYAAVSIEPKDQPVVTEPTTREPATEAPVHENTTERAEGETEEKPEEETRAEA